MKDIVKYKQFFDDGRDDRESENFQQFHFKDLNFEIRETPISFFRSDFREVKMERVLFMGNEFERADFMDSYLTDSTFTRVHFGTDFINVYFNNVKFIDTQFDKCTFLRCVFNSCEFKGGHIIDSTVQNCTYISSKLDRIEFKENTFEDIEFDKSTFFSIDLANMTAKDFRFRNCTFSDLKIDPDYLGSYLIDGDFFNNIKFEYRGKQIELFKEKEQILEALIRLWQKSSRFYELFNLLILYRKFSGSQGDLREYFKQIIVRLDKIQHPSIRSYNLSSIIKALNFYLNSNLLQIREYFDLIRAFEQIIDPYKDFTEFGLFKAFYNQFEKNLIEFPQKGEDLVVKAVFELKEKEGLELIFEEWLDEVENFFIKQKLFDGVKLYNKVSVERGSIIITILGSLSFILFIIRQIVTLKSKVARERSANKFVTLCFTDLANSLKEAKTTSEKAELAKVYIAISSKDQADLVEKSIS